MAELIIHSGNLQGRRLVLPERELLVGRDDECQMKLASNLVSRRHCILKVTPEGIWVHDLKSQNGTYINDVAVAEPQLLKAGDILRIGAALFQVPPPAPPARVALKKKGLEKISDADIADWLNDDDLGAKPGGGDTTVIHGRTPVSIQPERAAKSSGDASSDSTINVKVGPSGTTPQSASRTSASIRSPVRSVKEEAADIIRQHWESVRAKRAGGSQSE